MLVAQPCFGVAGTVGTIAQVAVERLPRPAAGGSIALPPRRQPGLDQVRDSVVIVINRLHDRLDFVGRLSLDLASWCPRDRACRCCRRKSRSSRSAADAALDVVLVGRLRIFENHDVPTLGIGEVEWKLRDQDPIPFVRRKLLPLSGLRIDIHLEPTVRADARDNVPLGQVVRRIDGDLSASRRPSFMAREIALAPIRPAPRWH